MTDPRQLRKEILAARDLQSAAAITEKSRAILTALTELDELAQSRTVFIYVNFRSEVQTLPIIAALQKAGKQVTVPLTRVAEKRLEIITLVDPNSDLVPGYCGIPEPRESLAESRACSPDELDIIFLPGSVFDTRGGRYGYGGGYYDRLLASIPRALRIALAFELQVVDKLALQEHDELVDYIVTEKKIIRPPIPRSAISNT